MERTERRIRSARISAMPKKMTDPMPTVTAILDDGTEEQLFWYYPDEISFSEHEFVGLTVAEGRGLKFQKDVKYLRS